MGRILRSLKEYRLYAFYVIVIILILLQLVYIHTQIRSIHASLLTKGLAAQTSAQEVSHRETRLRVYPLFVNLKTMNILTNHSSALKKDLKQMIDNENHILPYVCPRSIENVNVRFTKVGILVADMGGGADNLYTDVKNGYIKYILVKDQVYMLSINDAVYEYLLRYTRVRKLEREEYDIINSRVFLLYPLHNHEVFEKDRERVSSVSCRFELAPFLGRSFKRAGSDYLLNFNIEVIPSSVASRVPMHVIGYRT